jgi:orotidine-5'-phosphate decarboxylase
VSNGKFTWYNKVKIFHEDEGITYEFASLFTVYDQNMRCVLGNAHLFKVRGEAVNIVVQEAAGKVGQKREMVGIYLLNENVNSKNLLRDEDILHVFPETKSIKDLSDFSLVLRYSIPWYRPVKEKFNTNIAPFFFLRDYLSSLICPENEALNGCEILIYPPTGCYWDEEVLVRKEISERVNQISFMALSGETGLHIDRKSIKINLRPKGPMYPTQRQVAIQFTLPIVQDLVTLQSYKNRLDEANASSDGEQVVVFVCDLRGSTGQTRDGRPLPNVLTYHGIWRRDAEGPFRLLKIVGDQVLAVCNPVDFLREGLTEILRAYEKSLQLELPIRGGFHIGLAQSIGSPADTMSVSAIGVDFLGNAINHGSKIGDFKANENGLIASDAFIEWIKGETDADPEPVYWQDMSIGDKTVRLFRIEPGKLRRIVQKPLADRPVLTVPDRLVARAKKIESRLIIGLDPDIYNFPAFLKATWMNHPTAAILEDIIFRFNRAIIKATSNFAVAFKPQIAFYEQYGEPGLRALRQTIRFLRENNQIVILDAKRNDIEHTAKAYADAWLAQYRPFTGSPNEWRVDAITLNAYLGIEGVTPFLEANKEACIFVLAKTSNASSADLQDLKLEKGTKVFEEMARLADAWGKREAPGKSGYSRVGLVVGATHLEVCEQIRKIAPAALFLMPGVGAQGAPLQSIKRAAGDDGFGAYASSSRTVLYKFAPDRTAHENWEEGVCQSAGDEAKKLRDAINKEFAS